MKKKTLLFMTIFLFFCGLLSVNAQPHPRRPKPLPRKMTPQNEDFSVIGAKIEESDKFLTISIFFNAAVDSSSVNSRNILINKTELPAKTEFLFNKNRHMVRFQVSKIRGEFSCTIANLSSFDERIIKTTELNGLEANSFYKFSRESHTWQKSSL